MTRDELIRMAREMPCIMNHIEDHASWSWEEAAEFAALVAAAQREECANLCDWLNGEKRLTPAGCAAAIRALGQS